MLYTIILTVIILICILLTIVILLQPGQGGGLAGGIAGGSLAGGGAGLGARRTADLLSKSTTVLATALLVLCVLANFAIDSGGQTESAVQQSGVEQPAQQQQETPSAVPSIPQGQDNTGNDGSDDGGNDQ